MGFSFNNTITKKFNALKDTTLSGHFINGNVLSEEGLERRFSKPQSIPHNVTFEFTTDEHLLNQYFAIRENAYRQYLGLKNFSGQRDEFDDSGYIMVAKSGSVVVGGARLTICDKQRASQLPLEKQEYDLGKYFPDIDFNRTLYCETSRMAFLPEFRSGLFVLELCNRLAEFSMNAGAYVGFAIAPVVQAKRYKAILTKLGHEVVIRDDIKLPKVPTYGDIQPLLCAVDFSQNKKYLPLLRDNIYDDVEVVEYEFMPELQPA